MTTTFTGFTGGNAGAEETTLDNFDFKIDNSESTGNQRVRLIIEEPTLENLETVTGTTVQEKCTNIIENIDNGNATQQNLNDFKKHIYLTLLYSNQKITDDTSKKNLHGNFVIGHGENSILEHNNNLLFESKNQPESGSQLSGYDTTKKVFVSVPFQLIRPIGSTTSNTDESNSYDFTLKIDNIGTGVADSKFPLATTFEYKGKINFLEGSASIKVDHSNVNYDTHKQDVDLQFDLGDIVSNVDSVTISEQTNLLVATLTGKFSSTFTITTSVTADDIYGEAQGQKMHLHLANAGEALIPQFITKKQDGNEHSQGVDNVETNPGTDADHDKITKTSTGAYKYKFVVKLTSNSDNAIFIKNINNTKQLALSLPFQYSKKITGARGLKSQRSVTDTITAITNPVDLSGGNTLKYIGAGTGMVIAGGIIAYKVSKNKEKK